MPHEKPNAVDAPSELAKRITEALGDSLLDALRDFNLAGAHPFHGESSRWRHGKQQELQERLAAISVWRLESYSAKAG